ncbi:Signal transduction histidine kinase [Streptomyces sp. SceaMP-e96]|uniref:sensor histidine kinase n=1 Tax=Streptomyces TaxID=1883 RepID=UPI000823CF63|nr:MULTISPECIES: histidine kinase [unclassified Streptomyces]MYT17201.1 two-component sensor histidine kinase [Streptomyces sp. SID4951]SCK40484.1 Signal transduction histidine kinase [Streptomyces sp. SceaMP-e96]
MPRAPRSGWPTNLPRHRAVAKAGPALLLLLLVGLEAVGMAHQPARPHATMAAIAVAVCLCAVPSARIPLTVRAAAAAVISLTGSAVLLAGPHPAQVWGLGEGLALLLLLAGVVRRAPARTAAVLGPLLGLACVLTPLRDLRPGIFTVVQAVLTVVVAAYSLTLRRQDAQRLRDLAAVRAAERLELARELHDLVAHHVTGIVVQARAARYTALDGPPAGATFERIETAGSEALGAMRRLVRVLREDGARAHPLAGLAEVRAMTDTFSRTGPPVVLALETGAANALPAEVAAAVHRIVREALTNVRKHAADATAVRIGLRSVPRGVELRVANDGGAPARLSEQARGGGFGLAGLTERAEAMGGRLTAGPAPEGGWELTAVLPLDGGATA